MPGGEQARRGRRIRFGAAVRCFVIKWGYCAWNPYNIRGYWGKDCSRNLQMIQPRIQNPVLVLELRFKLLKSLDYFSYKQIYGTVLCKSASYSYSYSYLLLIIRAAHTVASYESTPETYTASPCFGSSLPGTSRLCNANITKTFHSGCAVPAQRPRRPPSTSRTRRYSTVQQSTSTVSGRTIPYQRACPLQRAHVDKHGQRCL